MAGGWVGTGRAVGVRFETEAAGRSEQSSSAIPSITPGAVRISEPQHGGGGEISAPNMPKRGRRSRPNNDHTQTDVKFHNKIHESKLSPFPPDQ